METTVHYEVTIEHKELGKKVHKIEVSGQKMVLPDFVPYFYDICDTLIDFELSGQKISCKKGCSSCCNQLLPLSAPEAFYIYRIIHEMPDKKKKLVKARFGTIFQKMEAKNMFTHPGSKENGEENKDEKGKKEEKEKPPRTINIDQEYYQMGLSCPFLDKNSCLIYDKRPFICRWYNVLSSPENCLNPYEKEITQARVTRNLGTMFAAFAASLFNIPARPVPLPLALRWIKDHPFYIEQQWVGTFLFEIFMNGLIKLNDDMITVSTTRLGPDGKPVS